MAVTVLLLVWVGCTAGAFCLAGLAWGHLQERRRHGWRSNGR